MKLNVIYGPPCSGKTTYVREHKAEGDIVIDLDYLKHALTFKDYHDDLTSDDLDYLWSLRNYLISAPKEKSTTWLITTEELTEDTDICDEVETIKMDRTKEEIYKMIDEDDTRPDKDKWKDLVDKWYSKNEETAEEARTMPQILKQREYRNLLQLSPLQEEKQKRIDSDHYIEGYATTWDPYVLWEYDGIKYYEKIDRNAFNGADMSDIIMQYDHQGKVFARKSNGTLIVETDDHGLFMAADLSKSQAARDMYTEIDSGLVTKMSWAFTVAEEAYDRDTRTRTILKIKKVYDVSAVSIPANDGTEISARSYLDGVMEVEKREALERERQIELFKFRRYSK